MRDWRAPAHTHLLTPSLDKGHHQHLVLGFQRSVYTSAAKLGDEGERVSPNGDGQQEMEAIEKVQELFGDLEQYEGLPPLTEILNEDEESEERAARRAAELQKQVRATARLCLEVINTHRVKHREV